MRRTSMGVVIGVVFTGCLGLPSQQRISNEQLKAGVLASVKGSTLIIRTCRGPARPSSGRCDPAPYTDVWVRDASPASSKDEFFKGNTDRTGLAHYNLDSPARPIEESTSALEVSTWGTQTAVVDLKRYFSYRKRRRELRLKRKRRRRKALRRARADEAWKRAKKAGTTEAFSSFARDFPEHAQANEARKIAQAKRAAKEEAAAERATRARAKQHRQRVAEWKKYRPRLAKQKRVLVTKDPLANCCKAPELTCGGKLLDDGSSQTVIASTRRFHGVAAGEVDPPYSLEMITCWVAQSKLISVVAARRAERRRKLKEARQQRAAERQQRADERAEARRRRAEERKIPVAVKRSPPARALYDAGFRPGRAVAVGSALARYARIVSIRGVAGSMVDMVFARAAGFRGGGGEEYAKAMNRLAKGLDQALTGAILRSFVEGARASSRSSRARRVLFVRRFLSAAGARVTPEEAGKILDEF